MIKKFQLFDSDSLKLLHRRVFFSITIFVFVFLISIYRISSIMLFPQDIELKTDVLVKDPRGNIYDRNGNILATSIKSRSLSINPNKIKNKSELSKKLGLILNINPSNIESKLKSNKKFVWVKRNISPKEYEKIINLGEINIQSHNEYKRIYPYRNIPSHIVGHVNIDQNGQNGAERFFDDHLTLSKNIFLSLDINLQQLVRKNLLETIDHYNAESGLAIVMDIENGQILSSVSLPDYNPENKLTFSEDNLVNRVFQSNFEMGSTFKPITATIAYDLGIVDSNMKFDVTKKFLNKINDFEEYKGDGIYNIEKIIVESSNIGTAQIADKIGKNNQKKFFKKLGFDDRIKIENKEATNPLGNRNNWGKLETATIGFGHGYSITPLHLVKAYGTLSNSGIEVFPTLQIKDSLNKKTILENPESSKFFLNLLQSVVSNTEYTGPRVKVEGYNVGGKTGTSELIKPSGGYYKDRNMTSFISIFPINKPKFVIYTAIEYPKKEKGTNQKMTGARVNAPLVKEIIINIINLFNISVNSTNEVLKADINLLYKPLNAPI